MPALFVDTSAFYAVADESDRHHARAEAVFVSRATAGDLVTTDHVFVETWCLIRARLGRKAAMRFWDAMARGVVRMFGVRTADLVRAREIAREWDDQAFSLIDCTSFALLERRRIPEVLAFDAHCRLYRFGPQRRSGLRVLP